MGLKEMQERGGGSVRKRAGRSGGTEQPMCRRQMPRSQFASVLETLRMPFHIVS